MKKSDFIKTYEASDSVIEMHIAFKVNSDLLEIAVQCIYEGNGSYTGITRKNAYNMLEKQLNRNGMLGIYEVLHRPISEATKAKTKKLFPDFY